VIDHGLRKWHHSRASSTLRDIRDGWVVRRGACFEAISDVLARQFGVALVEPDAAPG
jgi:hypothetical protein